MSTLKAHCAAIISALLGASGCAGISAVPARDGQPANGIPIYELKPILIVDAGGTNVKLIPNYNRKYGLRLYSFLAKNDSIIKLQDGLVTEIDADLDSTAAIDLVKLFVTEAAKVVSNSKGIGLPGPQGAGAPERFGVYEFVFSDAGELLGLRPLIIGGSGLTVVPKSTQQFQPLPPDRDNDLDGSVVP